MPYDWTINPDGSQRLALRPYRSLTPSGFVTFIGATTALLALPLLTLVGQPALWFVLIFAGAAVWGTWAALRASSRAASRGEVLTLTADRLTITHTLTRPPRRWETNPYWVQVRLTPTGGPVPNYLTLKGRDREVELGAFLTPEERKELAEELRAALAALRQPQ